MPWKQNDNVEAQYAKTKLDEPQMDGSSIRGCRIQPKGRNKLFRIPVITISTSDETEENLSNRLYDPDDVSILKIQDCEIINDKFIPPTTSDEQEYTPMVFNLIFESTQVNQQVEQKIVLENKGVFAITYSWCDNSVIKPIIEFPHERNEIDTFKFNKNSDIILPGQIVILPVWYNPQQKDVGNESVELWEFDTEPKISSSPIIFNFQGYCSVPTSSVHSNVWSLSDGSIYESITESFDEEYLNFQFYEWIPEIISNILDNVCVEQPSHTDNINSMDINIFITKYPGYYYHPKIVKEFKEMYNEVTGNFTSLRELSLDKLRNVLLTMRGDMNKKNLMLEKFYALCRESLKPSSYIPVMNFKYEMTYNILCAFANKFEDESELVRRHCHTGNPILQLELQHLNNDVTPSMSIMSQASHTSMTKSKTKLKKRQLLKLSGSLITSPIKTSMLKRNSTFTHETNIAAKNTIERTIDLHSYVEILCARIYVLLNNTILQICAGIDSLQNDN